VLVAGTHDFSEQCHSLDHKVCPIEIRAEIYEFVREFLGNVWLVSQENSHGAIAQDDEAFDSQVRHEN
jgi:hypothetical protein